MKKFFSLDRGGFLLVETLLVSLTAAGILLYLYVQYSQVTDSYSTLSQYNTVESLYRTNFLKKVLINNADVSFFGNSIKKIGTPSGIDVDTWNQLSANLEIGEAYLIPPKKNYEEYSDIFSAKVLPFMKTVKAEEENYQLVVLYNDNTIASVAFAI